MTFTEIECPLLLTAVGAGILDMSSRWLSRVPRVSTDVVGGWALAVIRVTLLLTSTHAMQRNL